MSLPFHLTVGFRFDNAMTHCDNLVKIDQRAGGGRGRTRMVESSVNRAVIVLAIASWQAFVQDTTYFLLHRRMPQPTHQKVLREIDRSSTPSAENTCKLLRLVDFDPRPYCTWDRFKPPKVEARLRDWLTVRHAIAHGDEKIPSVAMLEAVRENKVRFGPGGPSIRVDDARQCTAFIRKLAWATLDGVAREM